MENALPVPLRPEISRPKPTAPTALTPAQPPGPFYPGTSRFAVVNDLTLVPGAPAAAEGKIIYVSGAVVDQCSRPIPGARVEIWQACASGRYEHAEDPNLAPLDPHFGYRGAALTGPAGDYWFKTIIPGPYPAEPDWERPPHIHFRVSAPGFRELVTQLYFRGDPRNEADRFLRELTPAARESLLVAFGTASGREWAGALRGRFDLVLAPETCPP